MAQDVAEKSGMSSAEAVPLDVYLLLKPQAAAAAAAAAAAVMSSTPASKSLV